MRYLTLLLVFIVGATTVQAAASSVESIYPDELWENSVALTKSNFDSTIASEISKGKTLFVRFISSPNCRPSKKQSSGWNYVVAAFKDNADVSFADVDLKKEHKIVSGGQPGSNGWPAIRYYNQETGVKGADYVRRRPELKMSEELKIKENMIAYVESRAGTTMCSLKGDGCDDIEKAFVKEMRTAGASVQSSALASIGTTEKVDKILSMVDDSLKWELKRWIGQRHSLLKLLANEKCEGALVDEGKQQC
eukprot:CAMPEP_0119022138 /NCGR_PEP_ID=MMETSP1176-20130426/27392_1 /TAXON_ID=265551 /ORGANISM="Synedropsis recta cf, Strain CCMP1620" /LENGTH=249 /DNA_ID=CAMNT_0006976897 /DNA_START=27 /DNA_END=776 /DNA_ORIENTATION=+